MKLFEFNAGIQPLLISFPHSGTWLPERIGTNMQEWGRAVPDTDWFLPRLYQVDRLECSWIVSNVSRYLVDLNRPPDSTTLYPGQKTTGLCPLITFAEQPIYLPGKEPDESEVAFRRHSYWKPYHEQLQAEMDRLLDLFPRVALLDAHSIASRIPMLFEGQLDEINLGTNHGQSVSPDIQLAMQDLCHATDSASCILNGRFVGGFITRNYGQNPRVNAVQLELAQRFYMNETEVTWDERQACQARIFIDRLLEKLLREVRR